MTTPSPSAGPRPVRHVLAAVVLLVVVSATVACGGEPASSSLTVAATDGAELFESRALGAEPGCVTCHSLEPGAVLVGPSLADLDVAAAAAGVVDTQAYVRQSILDPAVYIVPGFEDARPMPPVFGQVLTPQQVDALVDYLAGAGDDR